MLGFPHCRQKFGGFRGKWPQRSDHSKNHSLGRHFLGLNHDFWAIVRKDRLSGLCCGHSEKIYVYTTYKHKLHKLEMHILVLQLTIMWGRNLWTNCDEKWLTYRFLVHHQFLFSLTMIGSRVGAKKAVKFWGFPSLEKSSWTLLCATTQAVIFEINMVSSHNTSADLCVTMYASWWV